MKKLLQLFDEYFFFAASLFFLIFIPLYPKLPVIDIFGTWVYIRIEDFLIAFVVAALGFQFIRKKIQLHTPLTTPIVFYWTVGLFSLIISLIFIAPTLSNFFPHVAILHYLRRIEYMILFFVAFASIKNSPKRLAVVVGVLCVTLFGVVVYGVGQKYAGFPAYLTMNEEFAKGVPLRLPPTARIASTFAGHYDLAAYLVLIIPIFGSLIFGTQKKLFKILYFVLAAGGFVLLLFTASRISFGVYLVTISTMLWWSKKKLFIVPVIIASVIAVNFVSGASERFLKTLRFNDVVVDLSTGKPIGTLEKLEGGQAVIEKIAEPDEENLPKGTEYISVPTETAKTATESAISTVLLKKDLEKGTGDVATVSGSFLVQKAFVLDISITTRLQGQWPKAIAAFKRNIFTGSGYSTLSLAADGNYHRMLGETGILGFVAYTGIFLYSLYLFWHTKEKFSSTEKAFLIGVFSGIVGLSLNAVLIDVFEASKVAFTLWLLLGFAMAILSKHARHVNYFSSLAWVYTNKYARIFYVIVALCILYFPAVKLYFVGDDFTWLKWAAESSFSDIPSYFTNAAGFFYRPIPKLWYFVLFSLFWLKPSAYHIASIFLMILTIFILFAILKKRGVGLIYIIPLIAFFSTMSIHHEMIYWISTQSHLLAAVFLMGAIYSFYIFWEGKVSRPKISYAAGFLFLIFSMLSYDPMGIAPVAVATIGIVGFKKRKSALAPLILVPIYVLVYKISGAVGATGDYGINISKIVVNAVANSVTYVASFFAGPKAIEFASLARDLFRGYVVQGSIGIVFILAVLFFFIKQREKKIQMNHFAVVWGFCIIIFLLPFVGLGQASERYAFFSALFFILFLGEVLMILERHASWLGVKIIPIILLLSVSVWNFGELKRIEKEWLFAGNVTEKMLLSIRKQFFPPTEVKTFVFINTPIRYGRAWIFPTGLNDSLWHMFRSTPFYTVQVSSVQEALAYPHPKDTGKIILEFDNYIIKQIVEEPVAAL